MEKKENKVGGADISKYVYSVNSIGQRSAVDVSGSAFATQADWNWGYDSLGQVVSAQHVNTSGSSRHYTFNNIGDRTEHREGTHTTTGGTATTYTPTTLNQYSAVGSVNPIYDTDGNMTSGPIPNAPTALAAFTWDGENRLLRVTPDGGSTTTFLHDAMGRRVAKTTGTTRTYFLYDGWNILAEYTGSVHTTGTPPALTLERTNVWGTDLSGSQQGAGGVGGLLATYLHNAGGNSGFYYPTYDGNGNVSEYLNNSGVVQAHFEYGPFGEPLTTPTGVGMELPFRFSTKYADAETGLYSYIFRPYDPLTGRWLSRDPIEEDGGVNLYGFVENDSINRIDPFGLVDIVAPGVMPFGLPYRMHPDTSYLTDAGRQYFGYDKFQQVGSGASLLDHLFTLGATSIADGFTAGGNIADQMFRGSERGDRRHRIISHSQGFTNAIFGVEDFARNYGSRLKRPTTILIVGASPKLAPGIIDNKLRAASQLAPCLKISVLILYGTHDGIIPTFRLPPVGTWPAGNMQSIPNAEIGVPVSLRATVGHDWRATLGSKPTLGAYGMIPEAEAAIAKEVGNEIRSYLRSGKLPQSGVIIPKAIPVSNP